MKHKQNLSPLTRPKKRYSENSPQIDPQKRPQNGAMKIVGIAVYDRLYGDSASYYDIQHVLRRLISAAACPAAPVHPGLF